MNGTLLGGRVTPEMLGLVLLDANQGFSPLLTAPSGNKNQALLQTLKRTRANIHQTQEVCRSDMVMLDSHFPEALNNLPLTVWTKEKSTTGVKLALLSFDRAIDDIDTFNRQDTADRTLKLLDQEIHTVEEFLPLWDESLKQGRDDYTATCEKLDGLLESSAEVAEVLGQAAIRLFTHAQSDAEQRIIDGFRASYTGFAERLLIAPLNPNDLRIDAIVANSEQLLTQMVGLLKQPLEGAFTAVIPDYPSLPFSSDVDEEKWVKLVDLWALQLTYNRENRFVEDVLLYNRVILPALYGAMQIAGQELSRMLPVLKTIRYDIAQHKESDLLKNDTLVTLQAAQELRALLFRFFTGAFGYILDFGLKQNQMFGLVVNEADEELLITTIPANCSMVEAHDGYVMEGAGESLRRAFSYLTSFLKRIVNWIGNTIARLRNNGAVGIGKELGNRLAKLTNGEFDERQRKRLQRIYSEGMKNIAQYTALGNIWSDTFKQTITGLQAPMAKIDGLFKVGSKGNEINEGDVNTVLEELKALLSKLGYSRLPGIEDNLTLITLPSAVTNVDRAVKASLVNEKGASDVPEIDDLRKITAQAVAFLDGPIEVLTRQVNGAELKNMLVKIESMSRLTVKESNWKTLGVLTPLLDGVSNLIRTASSLLGIAARLSIASSSFIRDLSAICDISEKRAQGELKQEAFKPDVGHTLLGTPPDLFAENADLLSFSGFTATRSARLSTYWTAMSKALCAVWDFQRRREIIQTHLRGITVETGDNDVGEWTLGLDCQDEIGAFWGGIRGCLETFNANPVDVRGALLCLNPEEIAVCADPNGDASDGWTGYYRELVEQAHQEHREFTNAGRRKGMLLDFISQDGTFKPPVGEVVLGSMNQLWGLDGTDKVNVDSEYCDTMQQFAAIFVAAVNAYIHLRYGSDHLLYRNIVTCIPSS